MFDMNGPKGKSKAEYGLEYRYDRPDDEHSLRDALQTVRELFQLPKSNTIGGAEYHYV